MNNLQHGDAIGKANESESSLSKLDDRTDFDVEAFLIIRRKSLRQLASLTLGEMGVLNFVARGIANKVTARRLGVSTRTVEKRRENLMKKLHVETLADLMRVWFQANPAEIGLVNRFDIPKSDHVEQSYSGPDGDRRQTET